MKKIILLCLLGQWLWAQPHTIPSKVENVTVFLNGAQITRSAKVSLPVGRTELLFKGISPQINANSIQVKSEGRFTILSVSHKIGNMLDKPLQEEINAIDAQKKQIALKMTVEKNNLLVYQREEEILLKNQVVGGTQAGMKTADLKESIDFQRQRMAEVLTKKLEFQNKIEKLEEETKKLNQQLTEINARKDALISEISVTVSAKEPVTNAPVSINYFVKNAGWAPTYDFRIEKLSQPLRMAYKANVYQFSGEDWKDIKLSLSTANPFKSGQAPILQKWTVGQRNDYSDYYNQVEEADNQGINSNQAEVFGKVTGKSDKQPLPGVQISLKGTSLSTSTDANGYYRLTIPPQLYGKSVTLIFDYIGYYRLERPVISNRLDVMMDESVQALNEVVVTGYALAGRAAGVEIAGNNDYKKKTVPLDITERDAPTSQSFDILVPYSVPSDGKVITVEIKEESIPAVFQHFTIPKIDTDVFLNAQIINWEKYKLLPGEASLFIENTYVGKSNLNLFNKDTLSLSFGRDKNVIISRTQIKSYQKKQFIGSNKTEQFAYEIVARNTKNETINLVIEDQFPVSNTRDVSIDDKEAPEAEVNTETGKIKWTLTMAPAKEYKVGFKYTIKSPKSGMVLAE
ncbi:mucoidy inhibitor MuiA family protein [Emticicia sp. 21SJ11W-3]|uniref:mucoidy inhibitor MuiA family protein n=1 Tax=Emticicia sp. 21SJ11W-3 TaxID=2916755 RepID=UPI00209F0105|nr:mucoidy inhibitor MuiA family protein [Emticicia sp. 21SJ11W-3]UTA66978.1 mucoidy inhibitor MuiA family protein [Emticicia sp. 21SJ11W-3]